MIAAGKIVDEVRRFAVKRAVRLALVLALVVSACGALDVSGPKLMRVSLKVEWVPGKYLGLRDVIRLRDGNYLLSVDQNPGAYGDKRFLELVTPGGVEQPLEIAQTTPCAHPEYEFLGPQRDDGTVPMYARCGLQGDGVALGDLDVEHRVFTSVTVRNPAGAPSQEWGEIGSVQELLPRGSGWIGTYGLECNYTIALVDPQGNATIPNIQFPGSPKGWNNRDYLPPVGEARVDECTGSGSVYGIAPLDTGRVFVWVMPPAGVGPSDPLRQFQLVNLKTGKASVVQRDHLSYASILDVRSAKHQYLYRWSVDDADYISLYDYSKHRIVKTWREPRYRQGTFLRGFCPSLVLTQDLSRDEDPLWDGRIGQYQGNELCRADGWRP